MPEQNTAASNMQNPTSVVFPSKRSKQRNKGREATIRRLSLLHTDLCKQIHALCKPRKEVVLHTDDVLHVYKTWADYTLQALNTIQTDSQELAIFENQNATMVSDLAEAYRLVQHWKDEAEELEHNLRIAESFAAEELEDTQSLAEVVVAEEQQEAAQTTKSKRTSKPKASSTKRKKAAQARDNEADVKAKVEVEPEGQAESIGADQGEWGDW